MSTAAPRIVVAINPQASFGARQEVGPAVVTALSAAGFEVVAITQPNGELLRRETLAAVDAGADALVMVGGDGMAGMGTNIVAGTTLPLGIIPSGTGNDVARGLGMPIDDTDAAIRALLDALERGPRVIDAGRVRQGGLTTWFIGVLSAGFDAIVNERANRISHPRGKSRYTLAMLIELVSFRPIEYVVTTDSESFATRAMLISVANNRSIGGGMMIAPDAELDDGLLDLFIVTPMSKIRFISVFSKVFSGTHTSLPEVQLSRVRSVRLESPSAVAYADGERIGALPIEVEVVPGALRVLA
ncbi:diacylglycerol/lipid kinase family protein [Rathayibacter soli]|uniref:diacylglycerol/lipid kinase family protein n=1 Tax=Rathayibacter soli TaxID=3144168 RepID=UPI0027E4183B|nr:YegS/Rv2252/BmrU family lipid kinase [Glaciibacter superstes]